ncbi:MAG: serine/threonine-protein kinase [Planctomycetota bacterium]|nr:serine/threonine-protein kinase [Planctomycetota bacterium]
MTTSSEDKGGQPSPDDALRLRRAKTIFLRAQDAGLAEREEILDRECRDDAELRALVLDLLRGDQEPLTAERLADDIRAAYEGSTVGKPVESRGSRIGRYRLIERLGEGGFGVVFSAEQSEPVKRRVALKIIKLGMDTRQVVARFEQERQALAVLDHPNIAKVFDAGATETGRPYFVMELCTGEPIDAYCDRHKLDIPKRLELFEQVCAAVQHAHTKGIIHRDIKPSNAMVSTQDGRPMVKVIDFGVAKATASRLTEKTFFTEYAQMIGTPEYMSPEQAEGSLDVDTRTDVYALGVLLYRLLTGTTPFEGNKLRSAGFAEIQRIIREEDPPAPSTRLSQSTATIQTVAAQRDTEPRRLGLIVRGELDWIVMKALEKDRARRYDTAGGLAMDVRRFLLGDAVTAAPPSRVYAARKFIGRNRALVAATMAIAVSLPAGVLAFAWQARIASAERDVAVQARVAEVRQRQAAEVERDRASRVAEFMSGILSGAGPSVAKGRDSTMLREMLDVAAGKLEKGELKAAPLAELSLRTSIGDTYSELSALPEAKRVLEAGLAIARETHQSDHADTAAVLGSLATVHEEMGDFAAAIACRREALEMLRRLHPGDHLSVSAACNDLANALSAADDHDAAEPLYRESVAMTRRLVSGDDSELARNLAALGSFLHAMGEYEEAQPILEESLAMNRRVYSGDHPNISNILTELGLLHVRRGHYDVAEPMLREAIAMNRRLYSADHPEIARVVSNLASMLRETNRLDEAQSLYVEALEILKKAFPGDHYRTAAAMNNVGLVMSDRNDNEGAEKYLRESIAMHERVGTGPDTLVAVSISNLAAVLYAKGDLPGAESMMRNSLRMFKSILSPDAPEVLSIVANLQMILQKQGKLAEAEACALEALAGRRKLLGEEHPLTLSSIINLGMLYNKQEKYPQAATLLEQAEPAARKVLVDELAGTLGTFLTTMARSRFSMGFDDARYRRSEKDFLEAHALLLKVGGEADPSTVSCGAFIAEFYAAWEKAEPGKGYDAKAREWTKPAAK